MFFFEKYFSLFAFAVGWGIFVTIDFVLRMLGLVGTYGIAHGVILPYTAPIMSVIVIFAFLYFLSSPKELLNKKFYSACNMLMIYVLTATLAVDLIMRFTAFNQTYCRGMSTDEFAACKAEHKSAIWFDLIKLAAMLRLMFYSQNVLESLQD